MKNFYNVIFVMALMALLVGNTMAGTLTATTNRTSLNHNETLALNLQYDESTDEEPDTRALEQQFTIVSRNKASSIQLINGSASSSTTWYFELLPRKAGTALIPSFTIDGNFSEAITIQVQNGPNNSAQAQQDIYTETSLDKPRVFIQQQAIISWRLISTLNISDPQFLQPQIDGALLQDLGNRTYQRAGSNGNIERVIEQRYAVFPQKSGTILIPAQQFHVVVNTTRRSSMGIIHTGRSQARVNTQALQLEAIPADNRQNTDWLPTPSLDISQELLGTESSNRVNAGTAFTRIIRTQAENLSAEQLPAVNMQANNVKVYSEKPVLKNTPTEQGVRGLREDRAAIIATEPGKLVLPAITIPWFDVEAAQWREATLPETILEVLPAATSVPTVTPDASKATSSTATPSSPASASPTGAATENISPTPDLHSSATLQSTTTRWQIATAVLLLLFIATVIYIYRLQIRIKHGDAPSIAKLKTTDNKHHSATLKTAAEHGNFKTLLTELLAWAKQNPEHQTALQHPSVQPVIFALEKHVYGNGPAPDLSSVKALPIRLDELISQQRSAPGQQEQLDTLYR